MEEVATTIIKPRDRWISFDLHELWIYRELLYFLVWRDIKVRYRQAAVGVLWAILQPILTTAIFTILFSRLAQSEVGDTPYPLFALSGLLLWFFVSASLTRAAWSLVTNRNLVTKIYFPRIIIVLAAILAGIIDLVLSIVILLGLSVYYATGFTWQMALAPLFVMLALLLAFGIGALLGGLNVRYRDVGFLIPFILQIWMFISPVFYPRSMVPEKWQLIFALNPMTGIMDGFRSAIFGKPFDLFSITVSVALTLILGIVSLVIFERIEEDFADII